METTSPKINESYGDWIIIDDTPIYKKGQRYFKARCKCGKEAEVHWSSLRLGKTTCCKQCATLKRRGDFKLGQVVKGYTILCDTPVIKNQHCLWKVKCNNCKKEIFLPTSHLLSKERWFKCKNCATLETKLESIKQNGGNEWCTLSFVNKFKHKAEKRKIFFSEEITADFVKDLILNQKCKCALTGAKLYFRNLTDTNISIDRIDSSIGYIRTNVQIVTKQVNVCKHILTNDQFKEMCLQVVKYANQQPSTSLTTCEGSETNG